jgi:hypothetical protein
MTNTRWFNTDYLEEKCEEFVLLSEHNPEKAVRKIWPLLVVPSGLPVIRPESMPRGDHFLQADFPFLIAAE